jgi:hypothetical protein
MLHLDLPTTGELADLARRRADVAVSIYLPTTPVSTETDPDRLLLKNLARDALAAATGVGADKRRVAAIRAEIDDLLADVMFWRHQANGLVVLATPDEIRTYRVATALAPEVEVSDRFHLKPLMRTMNYFDACYVLALSEGAVRLLEVPADLPPVEVEVPGMPDDAASVGRARSLTDSSGDRSTGNEAERVRLRHYCRAIDASVRGLLSGGDVPLILASVSGIGDIYRSVNSYPHLATERIEGNPDRRTAAELAAAARTILDEMHDDRVALWHDTFAERRGQDRATTDLGRIARAATFGAVDSLLVDMDQVIEGSIDDDGRISLSESGTSATYGVTDEIARRVLLTGGEVLVVRSDEIPEATEPIAATLRYAF